MILDIIKYNQDKYRVLRKPCIDAKPTPALHQFIIDMHETVQFYKGVGLAAPQVGRSLNLFVVNTPTFQETFINPEVSLLGDRLQIREGCLSFPNMELPKDRTTKVAVRYYDKNWTQHSKDFDGILAIIIQHEYDHLQGKLIVDF